MKRALFILATFLQAYTCLAQQYLTQNFTTQDGLSHSNVFRIFQDKQGFLWFCTNYGLTVYNGQVFNSNFNDKDGLLNNSVMSIYDDATGIKYINSYKNGLLVLADSVKKYPINEGIYPGFSLHAMPLKDIIWIVGKPHLHKIKNNKITRCKITDKNGKDVAFTSIVRKDNDLLFCSSNGLYHIEDGTAKPFLPELVKDTVIDVAKDKSEIYWIGCKRKIIQVVAGKIVKEYNLQQGQLVKDILLDSHQNLWVALDGEGMLMIQNGVLRNITNSLVLNKTVVNDMLEDTEGNIWIATYGAGIFEITSLDILTYQAEGNNPNIYCRTLCGYENDKILIGSIGKVSLWDKGIIKPFKFKLLKPDQYIYFIKVIDSKIYLGTSSCLIVKDVKRNEEKAIKYNSISAAISMFYSAKHEIFIGDYTNVYKLENDKLLLDTRRPSQRYNTMYGDHDGNMWYGTDKGVLGPEKNKQNDAPAVWQNGPVNDIVQDSHGRVWFATDNGLLSFEHGKYKTFKTEQGLASNKCNTLIEDGGNKLWIGTLMGLNYIDLNTLQVTKYTTALYSDDILSLYYDHTNSLFAGTVNKLASINLNGINIKNTPPPVYITFVKTSRGQINMPKSLDLPYNENKVLIGFIALSYQNTGNVEYRYKIANLDDNWYVTKNTSIELSALPSGNYTFILNARKNGGSWSGDVILSITVATPFWQTWWFITATTLLCIALLFFTIRQQIIAHEAKRRSQLVLYNKVVYLKQQALSALINPHFIFNCMNSIQYFMDNNENDKANAYLADFAHLIRVTMEDAQKVYISLESEISRIKLYLSLEQLRFGDGLEYDISIDRTLRTHDEYIPNMILQPYVENAIWHGIMPKNGKGKIAVSFSRHNEKEIKIMVQDNGTGINSKKTEQDEKEGHYGMKLTEERLELLKQLSKENYSVHASEITNKDGECTGTLVEIVVTSQPANISMNQYEDNEQ